MLIRVIFCFIFVVFFQSFTVKQHIVDLLKAMMPPGDGGGEKSEHKSAYFS